MDSSSKEEFRKQLGVLLPAVVGLIGVIVGSAVSGWVQYRASSLSFDKDRMIESGKASRELNDELLQSATAYFSSLFALTTMSDAQLQDKELPERFRQMQVEGLKLSLVTSLPTSKRIIECNVKSAQLMGAQTEVARVSSREALNKSVSQAFLSVYGDLAKYRWRISPDSGSDELAYSLLQILGSEIGRKSGSKPEGKTEPSP